MKFYLSIDHDLKKVFRALTYVAGGFSALMMLLAVANVITRAFFNYPIFGTIELVSYGALLVGAFALAQNEMDDGNPVMTLLVDGMKPKARALCMFISEIICTVFFAAVTYRFFTEISYAAQSNQYTTTLEMPMSVMNAIMFLGFLCNTLAVVLKAIGNLLIFIEPVKANRKNTEPEKENGEQ